MRGIRVGLTPNTPGWLAWRAQGVTATDAAAILGLSPWTSAFDLWWRKHNDRAVLADGGALSDEFERSQRYSLGHALEPILARFFEEEQLPDGWRVGSGGCWQGRGVLGWLRATPDRMLHPSRRTRTPSALLELKTSSQHHDFGDDDGDGVPAIPVAYRVQLVHQCLVTGVRVAWLTVLTPSMQVRHYRIVPTQDELDLVLGACRDFEWSLRESTPPDIDGHEATTARIKDLWSGQDGATVEVDEGLAEVLWHADAEHKAAKAHLDQIRNQILATIGNGKAAVTADGRKVATRTVTRRRATDMPAVRDALASLACTFPFAQNALVKVAPDPTVALRITPPKTKKPRPITGETP